MKEIKITERNFTVNIDGVDHDYKITRPTFSIGNKADLFYKRAFGEALKEGLLTAFQMKSVMDDIKYFSKASEGVQKFADEVEEGIEELKKLTKDDEEKATVLVLKIKELRARKTLELFKINSVYDNSAESYAENARNQFYAAHLTKDAAGKKVWGSYDSFKNDMGTALCAESVTQVMLFNAQIGDNYEMEHEENQWLLANGFIDEQGNFIEDSDKEEEKKPNDKEEEVEVDEKDPVEKEPTKDTVVKKAKKPRKKSIKKSVKKVEGSPPNVTNIKKT